MASELRARQGVCPQADRDRFADIRQRDFARLDESGHVYLDYTGAALCPTTLVSQHGEALRSSILGNPHSINPASENAASDIAAARERVLDFFSADPDEYAVIFTANATAAIKLVAEGFAFGEGSEFLLSADNHNSVNGIREYARAQGATVRYCSTDRSLGLCDLPRALRVQRSNSLFAYPAQSNFSGVHHSLEHIEAAKAAGYQVLLDAAAYVATNSLDLSAVCPDFVCVSFYKMFGYPTGIGALIARRRSLALLRRPWFAGGTVDYVSTQHPTVHRLISNEHAFEDGSPNFTSVQGVVQGLDFLDRIGMAEIQSHTSKLIQLLVTNASALKHDNGAAVVRWYGGDNLTFGSTRAFNILHRDGSVIPYERIEQLAGAENISIRGGCFCNPGCAEAAFDFPASKALQCMERFADGSFSPSRFADCLGTTEVGALRVSSGIANNEADVHKFIAFIATLTGVRYHTVHSRPRSTETT